MQTASLAASLLMGISETTLRVYQNHSYKIARDAGKLKVGLKFGFESTVVGFRNRKKCRLLIIKI